MAKHGQERLTCALLHHIAEEGLLSHPGHISTVKTGGYCSSMEMESHWFYPHNCMGSGLVRPCIMGRGLDSHHHLRSSPRSLRYPAQPCCGMPMKGSVRCTALVSYSPSIRSIRASGEHVAAPSCTQHVYRKTGIFLPFT